MIVNGKDMNAYFARPVLQMVIGQAFTVAGVAGEFDVMCTVKGGGLSGQAGAVKHGISQALSLYEPSLRPGAEGRRLPDPRQPRGRAQEVRQAQGPPQLPVLQALRPRRPAGRTGGVGEDGSPCTYNSVHSSQSR